MRAMVLREQAPIEREPLTLEEVPEPQPGPGEVRLRVLACGVCHTDLHEVEGDLELRKRPVIPGHQVVGVVDARGTGASRFALGERVGVAWLYWTPPDCEFRARGLENLCPDAKFTGWDVDGGYAELMVVPEEFAYPIPEGLADVEAAPLLCAGIIGYRALRLAGAEGARRLGLYGFGASAHIAIQIARHWGCEVYVFTRSPAHRRHARELGAVWVGGADDDPGTSMHASIIFAPAGPLVPQALRVLERGGTVVCAGIYMTPIPEFDYELIYGERVLRSVTNATREDGEGLLRVAGEVPVRTDVTVFDLAQANEALRQVKHSEVSGAAVLHIGDREDRGGRV